MVTHPGSGTGEDTLVHALLHHWGGAQRPWGRAGPPGHRSPFDKETSGLIVVARDRCRPPRPGRRVQGGRENLQRLRPPSCSGLPKRSFRLLRRTDRTAPGGPHAHGRGPFRGAARGTDWNLERTFGKRGPPAGLRDPHRAHHQIRVHLSHLGHPLLGDDSYGFKPARFRCGGCRASCCTRPSSAAAPLRKAKELSALRASAGDFLQVEAELGEGSVK